MIPIFRFPILTLALCVLLVTTGCASYPNHIEWVDEASSADYTVIPKREVRPAPRVYRRSVDFFGLYTVVVPRIYYQPARTVYKRVYVAPPRQSHRRRGSDHHHERRHRREAGHRQERGHHQERRQHQEPRHRPQRQDKHKSRQGNDKRSGQRRSRRDNR